MSYLKPDDVRHGTPVHETLQLERVPRPLVDSARVRPRLLHHPRGLVQRLVVLDHPGGRVTHLVLAAVTLAEDGVDGVVKVGDEVVVVGEVDRLVVVGFGRLGRVEQFLRI